MWFYYRLLSSDKIDMNQSLIMSAHIKEFITGNINCVWILMLSLLPAGNAYSSIGHYEQAIKFHREELMISKEVNDRSSEASTYGNLAVAYQALGSHNIKIVETFSAVIWSVKNIRIHTANLNFIHVQFSNILFSLVINYTNCLFWQTY